MWLLVVSRSSDYWLGLPPRVTPIALVDVKVCLGIPLCVTCRVPRGSRGLILGSTGRGAPHSWEHWKGASLFVSRQCFPNIHENKVNKISECNLLHDIINPSKCSKYINIYYSPIIDGCMNTRKSRAKFNKFRILLDSGCSSMIVMRRLITKLKSKEDDLTQ